VPISVKEKQFFCNLSVCFDGYGEARTGHLLNNLLWFMYLAPCYNFVASCIGARALIINTHAI
jgi:hypothetical protein